jgi:predicted phosphoribosyltransferase
MLYRDRTEAGRLLAEKLGRFKGHRAIVYGLPRGGVVVAAVVAEALLAPLDLIIPRKIGHPVNPEYAVGAVTEFGEPVLSLAAEELDPAWLQAAIKQAQAEARRRRLAYGTGRRYALAEAKTAIIVDDGIATGLTMLAAIKEIETSRPARIVAAAPVIPIDTAEKLAAAGAEVVALQQPVDFLGSVGAYYQQFDQVDDRTVVETLKRPAKR